MEAEKQSLSSIENALNYQYEALNLCQLMEDGGIRVENKKPPLRI
jgi:hypothetical protein